MIGSRVYQTWRGVSAGNIGMNSLSISSSRIPFASLTSTSITSIPSLSSSSVTRTFSSSSTSPSWKSILRNSELKWIGSSLASSSSTPNPVNIRSLSTQRYLSTNQTPTSSPNSSQSSRANLHNPTAGLVDDGQQSDSDGGFSDSERSSTARHQRDNNRGHGRQHKKVIAVTTNGTYKLKVIDDLKIFANPTRMNKKTRQHYRHFVHPLSELRADSEIFIFSTGNIVGWNVTDEDLKKIMNHIPAEAIFSRGLGDIDVPSEVYSFYAKSGETSIENDILTLGDNTNNTKLAVSLALATSVKTSLVELASDRVLEHLREMARGDDSTPIFFGRGDPKLKLNNYRQALLNMKSMQITLSGDNDYFWDVPNDDEPLYKRVKTYLDVFKRVKVVGDTVDHALQVQETLSSEAQHKHSIRLENIIIALIAVEVVFGFVDHWAYLKSVYRRLVGQEVDFPKETNSKEQNKKL